jgi:hypothetical protein
LSRDPGLQAADTAAAASAAAATSVVLLGPQKAGSEVGAVLRDIGVTGRVALITAGWQEREADDGALVAELADLGLDSVNLRLHARSHEVFEADALLAAPYSARQERLRHLQGFYRIRLDHADDAAKAVSVRHVEPELLEEEEEVSVEQFRGLDRDHLERCRALHDEFARRMRTPERKVVARHVRELGAILGSAEAVVISGGHVASLLNRLRLFELAGLLAGRHLVAWSAGAMVLTDRIVLFHDFPPYGSAIAQVLDAGLGLAPGLVVLPDPRRRIRFDDSAGMARFARRMAPADCVAMDHGARVVLRGRQVVDARADRLGLDGTIERGWTGGTP